MRFILIRFVCLCAVCAFACPGRAEEEAKGGEGAAAGPETSREQREYVEKHTQMIGLASKIEEADKKFAELVEEKERATTSDAKQETLKEMVKVAKERAGNVKAYDAVRSELTLRYPSEGEDLKRRYDIQTPRAVEPTEGAVDLEVLLRQTKKLIDERFPTGDGAQRKPASVKTQGGKDAAVETPRLRLEK